MAIKNHTKIFEIINFLNDFTIINQRNLLELFYVLMSTKKHKLSFNGIEGECIESESIISKPLGNITQIEIKAILKTCGV